VKSECCGFGICVNYFRKCLFFTGIHIQVTVVYLLRWFMNFFVVHEILDLKVLRTVYASPAWICFTSFLEVMEDEITS
jgi:hypothetical protein